MELTDLRREIDRVDSEILRLLAERMALCDRVATYKSAHGLPILDEAREEEKLARAAASVPADLSGDARALYALLLSLSRRRQAALRKREVD